MTAAHDTGSSDGLAGPVDVPIHEVIRLSAANIAPVMDAAAVVLVLRLTPDVTVEVILSAAEADALARDLHANARYLRSRDPLTRGRP